MDTLGRPGSAISLHGLQIARELHDFVAEEAAIGTGIDPEKFWEGFSAIVHDLAPKNRAQLLLRNLLMGLMSLPPVANAVMGRSLRDPITLPPAPAPAA